MPREPLGEPHRSRLLGMLKRMRGNQAWQEKRRIFRQRLDGKTPEEIASTWKEIGMVSYIDSLVIRHLESRGGHPESVKAAKEYLGAEDFKPGI